MKAFGEQILKIEGNSQDVNIAKTNIESKATPNFAATATTKEGMFATADDYGTSYYYRGVVDNNYVKFGDFYWRIVRITGDGNIKLIYQGTMPSATGTSSTIGNPQFNSTAAESKHIGYAYDSNTNSTVKTFIDNWYVTNILNKGLTNYLSDTGFCGDRTSRGTYDIYYGPYDRSNWSSANNRNNPTLICPQTADNYTVNDNVKGNVMLRYPIAMLSADEVAMAGNIFSVINRNSYLYNNTNYWLLSPFLYDSSRARLAFFTSSGDVGSSIAASSGTIYSRPNIHLKRDKALIKSGDGTVNNPYVIKTNN